MVVLLIRFSFTGGPLLPLDLMKRFDVIQAKVFFKPSLFHPFLLCSPFFQVAGTCINCITRGRECEASEKGPCLPCYSNKEKCSFTLARVFDVKLSEDLRAIGDSSPSGEKVQPNLQYPRLIPFSSYLGLDGDLGQRRMRGWGETWSGNDCHSSPQPRFIRDGQEDRQLRSPRSFRFPGTARYVSPPVPLIIYSWLLA